MSSSAPSKAKVEKGVKITFEIYIPAGSFGDLRDVANALEDNCLHYKMVKIQETTRPEFDKR